MSDQSILSSSFVAKRVMSGCRWSLRSIGFSSTDDTNNGHATALVVDPVDDAVGAAAGAVSVMVWGTQSLAHPMRIVQQRADDQLVRGEGDGVGKLLGELATGRGSNDQVESFIVHAGFRRRRIASARACSVSPSPRASSASEAASWVSASLSERMAMVSSRASRSSTESSTAEGRPWTVTVTRSWWAFTLLTSCDR